MTGSAELKEVYDREYTRGRYSRSAKRCVEEHALSTRVKSFVIDYDLADKRCLEIGCGLGAFQDLADNYVGIDISEVAGRSLHKPFVVASATALPFADSTFDAAWTVATLEHVPYPEKALSEIRRVLRGGGLLLLAPAWYCRPWAAQGYAVRPYSDFDWRGKLIKASIPLRNSVVWRAPGMFWRRVLRLIQYMSTRQPTTFYYRELEADYEHNWTSDSDAVNSMDPFEAILWFISRGDRCLSYPTLWEAFFVRTGGIVFQIMK